MPVSQVANVANYDFGAGSSLAQVLKFRVLKGGKLVITFEAPEDTLSVSAQVSADDSTYAATSVANNLSVITAA
jgi:hypothetical protein